MLLPLALLLSSVQVNPMMFAGLQKEKVIKKDSAQIARIKRAKKIDSLTLALQKTDKLMRDIMKKDSIK